MPTVYGYARASTADQVLTIDVQGEQIKREYDHRFQATFAWGGVYEDRGVSGAKPFLMRGQGVLLNAKLEPGDCIIITKLDRGFRSLRDLLEVTDKWQKKGVRLVLLDLNMDTGTAVGAMMVSILGSVAEFERRRLSERTKEAMAVAKKQGRRITRAAPWGMMWVTVNQYKQTLVPNPHDRKLIQLAIGWREKGFSNDRIELHFLAHRVRKANGARPKRSWLEDNIPLELALQAKEAQEENGQATTEQPPT